MSTYESQSQAVEQLLHDLEHGDEFARREAAKALSHSDYPAAVRPLIALLDHSPDQDVRRWAAYTLGFMGDIQAKPALIAALRDPNNSLDVRCHAAEALGHLLPYRRGQPEARAALRETLEDGTAELRFWAAFALGCIGIQKDIPAWRALAPADQRLGQGWCAV